MPIPISGNSHVDEDMMDDHDARHTYAKRQRPRRAVGLLLALVLLVNLAMSLYQLPVNRVIERRLCREYYEAEDPTVIDPHGEIREDLCKIDHVQRQLAWIQGAMETAWIVGGMVPKPVFISALYSN
jgi:hypothetical protein